MLKFQNLMIYNWIFTKNNRISDSDPMKPFPMVLAYQVRSVGINYLKWLLLLNMIIPNVELENL